MSDDFDPHMPQRVRRDGWYWLAGRASRREYWIWVVAAFGLSVILGELIHSGGSSAMTVVLICAQVRRLHDFGRTGWWALGATLAPVAVMIPVWIAVSLTVGLLAAVVVELALIVWIGAVPGDAGANRFGDPPTLTWKHVLTGR
jgi:uncharacterized membrane protein YhaH (DUF805 family)